jgi:hypothetical protein
MLVIIKFHPQTESRADRFSVRFSNRIKAKQYVRSHKLDWREDTRRVLKEYVLDHNQTEGLGDWAFMGTDPDGDVWYYGKPIGQSNIKIELEEYA